MKRKLYSILLAAVLTVSALTGCASSAKDGGTAPAADTAGTETSDADGQSESAKGDAEQAAKTAGSGPTVIDMYHSWSTDTERGAALDTLISQFNEEHQGEIEVKVTVNPDFPAYQEKVKTMISTDTTPDIFHYNFNPNDLSRQESGKLMDFSPYMDEEWAARFGDGDLDTLTIDGQLTSIPFEKAGALIYYNTELFEKAGIKEFPATWDGLLEACETLKKNGITPISLYTADDAWYTCNLLTYLAAAYTGTETLNAGGSIETSEIVKAAGTLRKFMDYTTNDFVGANYSVAMNNFASEKTAIVIDGPWLIGSLTDIQDKVAVAKTPTFGDKVVQEGFTVTDAQTPWAAAKQSDPEKEKAIVEFMKFITSKESTKQLTLKGAVFLSPKLELTEEEIGNAGVLLSQYIKVNSASPESTVNLQRNLSTAANSKLPSLLESLALDVVTPEDFVKQLSAENK